MFYIPEEVLNSPEVKEVMPQLEESLNELALALQAAGVAEAAGDIRETLQRNIVARFYLMECIDLVQGVLTKKKSIDLEICRDVLKDVLGETVKKIQDELRPGLRASLHSETRELAPN